MKQRVRQFFVPHGQQGMVYAAVGNAGWCDDPDAHWSDEGTPVVALFSSKQTADQFANKRGLTVTPMHVYSSTRALEN
jgi:hypothetical protein